MSSERLLTYADVQARLSLSRTAVWQLIRDGKLKEPARIGRRARRFREADVDRWIRDQAGEDTPRATNAPASDGNPADECTNNERFRS